MTAKLYVQRPTAYPQRQVEAEGVLRLLLLAFALAMPMASMAYLKIQHTQLSYKMSEIRNQIRQEQEVRRTLLLERSHFQREEEIQSYADKAGLLPAKQSHRIPRTVTRENQRLTKLQSDECKPGFLAF